jgi:hypothetical protein
MPLDPEQFTEATSNNSHGERLWRGRQKRTGGVGPWPWRTGKTANLTWPAGDSSHSAFTVAKSGRVSKSCFKISLDPWARILRFRNCLDLGNETSPHIVLFSAQPHHMKRLQRSTGVRRMNRRCIAPGDTLRCSSSKYVNGANC